MEIGKPHKRFDLTSKTSVMVLLRLFQVVADFPSSTLTAQRGAVCAPLHMICIAAAFAYAFVCACAQLKTRPGADISAGYSLSHSGLPVMHGCAACLCLQHQLWMCCLNVFPAGFSLLKGKLEASMAPVVFWVYQ